MTEDKRRSTPATQRGGNEQTEEDLQPGSATGGVSQPDMNRDPLAGAMGESSMQADTLQDASEEDTGVSAKDDAAPPGGPASKNTSSPAGAQIGADAPPGAVAGDGTPTCPADFPIKGHQESMLLHIPGKVSYDDVVPTWCFANEADALNAGYSASDDR